jgi:hypothetical protein
MRRVLALLALITLSSGCASDLGALSVVSIDPVGRDFPVVERHVKGEECRHSLFFGLVPLGSREPTLDGAISKALSTAEGADALVNARVYQKFFRGYVYDLFCFEVKGDAVATREAGAETGS